MNRGIIYAVTAYIIWGFIPVYIKQLNNVPAPQLLSHRIVWSFVSLLIVILTMSRISTFGKSIRNAGVLKIYFMAAILIGINWFTYVWAVGAGFIVEASLGYFINPLISVLLGVFFLRERLRIWQWVPILIAGTGVAFLTFVYGKIPWIALVLAFSFGFYGMVKKKGELNSLDGLSLETGILLMPALIYIFLMELNGRGVVFHSGVSTILLLMGAGVITVVPLLLFASAVKKIALTTIGILQYIAPTLQFLVGVVIYKEPFNLSKLTGFGIIWFALIIFGIESWIHHQAQPFVTDIE
ncbi:MAG TPA: EamA family transporter RarD [Desulfomonilia bacterium]